MCGPASIWAVRISAPASAYASIYGSTGAIIKCTSITVFTWGRNALTAGGPKVRFGTKCPSMTSICTQSAPCASIARISAPKLAKSADKMDGAILMQRSKAIWLSYCILRLLSGCLVRSPHPVQDFSALARHLTMVWHRRVIVPRCNDFHRLLGGIDKFEQLQIIARNRPRVRQCLPIYNVIPKFPPKQQKWHQRHAIGLDQCQRFKQLIKRAKSPREYANRFGAHQKMHLANGKVMEIETQFRRHIGIGRLFMGLHNIQHNRFATSIQCTAVARLHHTWPTASRDNKFTAAQRLAVLRDLTRQFARLGVILGQFRQLGRLGLICIYRIRNPRAPKQNNR